MTNPKKSPLILIPIGLTVALLVAASPLPLGAAEITVADLQNKVPVGRLGKPLGTQMVLAGASPRQPVMLSNALEIAEVDGKHMASPMSIEIRGNVQIREGVAYRLEGYEAGEFSGDPMWFNPQVQQPFQYRVFFVVTKVLEPASK